MMRMLGPGWSWFCNCLDRQELEVYLRSPWIHHRWIPGLVMVGWYRAAVLGVGSHVIKGQEAEGGTRRLSKRTEVDTAKLSLLLCTTKLSAFAMRGRAILPLPLVCVGEGQYFIFHLPASS